MDRVSMVNRIGVKYLTSNIEGGEFSYVHSAVRNGRRCVSERTLCEAKRTPRNTKISSYSFGLITTV